MFVTLGEGLNVISVSNGVRAVRLFRPTNFANWCNRIMQRLACCHANVVKQFASFASFHLVTTLYGCLFIGLFIPLCLAKQEGE